MQSLKILSRTHGGRHWHSADGVQSQWAAPTCELDIPQPTLPLWDLSKCWWSVANWINFTWISLLLCSQCRCRWCRVSAQESKKDVTIVPDVCLQTRGKDSVKWRRWVVFLLGAKRASDCFLTRCWKWHDRFVGWPCGDRCLQKKKKSVNLFELSHNNST